MSIRSRIDVAPTSVAKTIYMCVFSCSKLQTKRTGITHDEEGKNKKQLRIADTHIGKQCAITGFTFDNNQCIKTNQFGLVWVLVYRRSSNHNEIEREQKSFFLTNIIASEKNIIEIRTVCVHFYRWNVESTIALIIFIHWDFVRGGMSMKQGFSHRVLWPIRSPCTVDTILHSNQYCFAELDKLNILVVWLHFSFVILHSPFHTENGPCCITTILPDPMLSVLCTCFIRKIEKLLLHYNGPWGSACCYFLNYLCSILTSSYFYLQIFQYYIPPFKPETTCAWCAVVLSWLVFAFTVFANVYELFVLC